MSTGNPILDAIYADDAVQAGGLEKQAADEEAAILLENLEELEKVAAANGYDLSQLSNEDIAELLAQQTYGDDAGMDKHAGAHFASDEQVAVADYLGRVQAQAMADEMLGMQKQAELDSLTPGDIDALAQQHATDILVALNQLDPNNPAHYDAIVESESREKVASVLSGYDLPAEVAEAFEIRTRQHLDAAGWDVEKIAYVLQHLAEQG